MLVSFLLYQKTSWLITEHTLVARNNAVLYKNFTTAVAAAAASGNYVGYTVLR